MNDNPTPDEIRNMLQEHVNSLPEISPTEIRKQESLTNLSYWFPKIEAAGIPVPKTKIVEITGTAQAMLWKLLYGEDSGSLDDPFFVNITAAANEMGFPCFLRTNLTSAKHDWKRSCFLPSADAIPAHIASIVEFSECADIMGLAWDTWAVREMLPTIPNGTCPAYGNMPVCKEFRFFVEDGKYKCYHPYWPLEALRDGGWDGTDDDYMRLCELIEEDELIALAEKTGAVLGGAWSIDILETKRGWYVTDLAEAHKSFHWEGCAYDSRE